MSGLSDPGRVAEQNASYRRGVVLGLTMAEVGILIVFVLLLLIGFAEWARAIEQQSARSVPAERLAELERQERVLTDIRKALDLPVAATQEQIAAMVRAVVERSSTPEGQSALTTARSALASMQAIRDELQAKGYPQDLLAKLQDQSYRLAAQEGQLKRYEGQLQAAGLGKGERPCWVKPDGTTEFLFDVVLGSAGIRMRENVLPARNEERLTLPMPVTNPDETLAPAEFLKRTEPLYQSSVARNCRFFVTIYDATGSSEKDLYKSLLRTVEGHFYKRLALDKAPF
jgi:hypothetical protein